MATTGATAGSAVAAKRVMRDLAELEASPLPGISIHACKDDITNLHANITINEGPWKDLLLHVVLGIPKEFPQTSPSGAMGPGYPFVNGEHPHVFTIGICNDFISNFDKHGHFSKTAGTGWTSAITLKTLLMILQPFFGDCEGRTYSAEHIAKVRNLVANYTCDCGHSTANPMPPIPQIVDVKPAPVVVENDPLDELICSVSKVGLRDDPNIILGYPINVQLNPRNNKIDSTLITELVSYDQYALEIQKGGFIDDSPYGYGGNYGQNRGAAYGISLRSATGQPYNCFLPLFINEENFKKAFTHITHAISVISNGIAGSQKNDFTPELVLRVLPCLINKTIVAMMNGNMHESESAIFAYCHLLRLLMRFVKMYPQVVDKMNKTIESFKEGKRSKADVPDIGEFIVMLSLSKYSYKDNDIQTILLNEYFARQVFWILKAQPKVLSVQDIPTRLNTMFKAAEVSNKLLVFNIVAAKAFIFPGVDEKLDANYGMPPAKVVSNFQTTIKNVKAIANYTTLMKAIEYDGTIKLQDDMVKFLANAWLISKNQKYHK